MQLFPLKAIINSELIEEREKFYLYQIEKESSVINGLLCSIPIENIHEGKLVPHEEIFSEKINPLYNDFIETRKQKNPILLFTDEDFFEQKVKDALFFSKICIEKKLSSRETHRLWTVPPSMYFSFDFAKSLCIADGHHRLKALLQYYQIFPENRPAIMAVIFNSKNLKTRNKGVILNRLPSEPSVFWESIDTLFHIEPTDIPFELVHPYDFQLFFKNQWFKLSLKPHNFCREHEKALGIEIFRDFILKKVCNLSSYSNNPTVRMLFDNFSSLKNGMTSVQQAGFIIAPDSPQRILEIAREGKVLEPNSTYFETKFPDSMVAYRLGSYDHPINY